MADQTPVTIISGSLGAGKTTLLNRLLAHADRRIAVLINDMGDVNVDASLIESDTELAREGVAELSNGCICCELQDDLEAEVRRLAGRYDFDHLIVEASGISEPAPVASLFTAGAAAARYTVDALVTVVDARRLDETVAGRSLGRETAPDETDRPLSDLLVEQIEVSNVVLLNKCDLVDDDRLPKLEAVIASLQPEAEVIRTVYSDVAVDRLLEQNAFDQAALETLPAWKRAITTLRDHHHDAHDHDDSHTHVHRTPESVYGISSFTYHRQRPFDPAAFAAALRDLPSSVVRAKGPVWIAGRDDLMIQVSIAGRSIHANGEGKWVATLPPAQQSLYRDTHPDIPWDDTYGDRRTDFVVIGTDLDTDAIAATFDACLVDPDAQPDPDDVVFPREVGAQTVLRQ